MWLLMLGCICLFGWRNILSLALSPLWGRRELIFILILNFPQWSLNLTIIFFITLLKIYFNFRMKCSFLLKYLFLALMFHFIYLSLYFIFVMIRSRDLLVLMLSIRLMMGLLLMVGSLFLMMIRLLMVLSWLMSWFMRDEFIFRLFLFIGMF